MQIINTFFDDSVLVLLPKVFGDDRGFFQESYNQKKFAEVGIKDNFIQDNHSFSKAKGTIRGLHFQTDPRAQSKLVRVVRGAALDVIVDIRKGSKTYGQYELVEISDKNSLQVYIPKGFAHGFCTLEENCHFCYKVDDYYSPENNAGIIWNDPDIAVSWPTESPILSAQDLNWKSLKEIQI